MYLARLGELPPADSPIFTEKERRYCSSRRHPGPHFAGRYAAKKAACIALSLAPDAPLSDIEVTRLRGRAPTLNLHGEVSKIVESLGTQTIHVSLSHSGDYAVALVVME
jgi:phosphopantetheine--protein transferase-like protein